MFSSGWADGVLAVNGVYSKERTPVFGNGCHFFSSANCCQRARRTQLGCPSVLATSAPAFTRSVHSCLRKTLTACSYQWQRLPSLCPFSAFLPLPVSPFFCLMISTCPKLVTIWAKTCIGRPTWVERMGMRVPRYAGGAICTTGSLMPAVNKGLHIWSLHVRIVNNVPHA